MSKDLSKPLKVLDAHNKIIADATSKAAKERVSRNIFNALRESFYQTTDSRARSRPGAMHHVYEWNEVGSPAARLYRLASIHRGSDSFAITYNFIKSSKPVPGSEPHVFFDKARVMEDNNPVVIEPVNGGVLSFEYDGQRVFTPGPVVVDDPGGPATKGAMNDAFAVFFRSAVIAKNPAYQAVIKNEKQRVLNALKKVK
jgi:hypothetical protein